MARIYETRFHGRGGQGAWTASELLAKAAIIKGKYIQSFPEFGPERMGAPVCAYTRISDEPITLHCGVYEPDAVAVLDPTLLKNIPVHSGLRDNGIFVINTHRTPEEICSLYRDKTSGSFKAYTVPATDIAIKYLGRPIVNTAVLGALAKGLETLMMEKLYPDALEKAIKERFPPNIAEKNIQIVKEAYNAVKSKEC